MAHDLLNNRSKSFWNEVKKVNGKSNNLPNMVDDVVGGQGISEVFANKYETLYNSVSYDESDMHVLSNNIEHSIQNSVGSFCINYDDVKTALRKIKRGKNDGHGILYTDHFINGSSKLYVLLTMLFNCMIIHGFTPDGFNISTIQPLVKNKRKSLNDSSNYRAIALSSPLAKILDWVILHKCSDILITSDNQYGFKEHSSTTQCTFSLMETVNYFKTNNSDAYVLLLDASQAFDKVNYVKLFNLLMKRSVNPLVIRCLLYMYTNQSLNVKWDSYMSKSFSTSNGVKQGGVLSPILFGVYIDELLCRLSRSGYGCKIGHLYYGALGYADDVSLIAPSLYALQKMCDVALEYANEYDIKFNPLKCQFLYFGSRNDVKMVFNDTVLSPLDKGTHLGHIIGPKVEESVLLDAVYTITRNVNSILHNFSHCTYDVKLSLFNAYCTAFYGSSIWNLSGKYTSLFYTAWRKSIRRILNIPRKTHCNILPTIADCMHIETQLLCRFTKFITNGMSNNNTSLKLLLTVAINGSRSTISKNVNYLLYRTHISRSMLFSKNQASLIKIVSSVNTPNETTKQIGNFARSVVFERDNVNTLSVEELDMVLNVICTE